MKSLPCQTHPMAPITLNLDPKALHELGLHLPSLHLTSLLCSNYTSFLFVLKEIQAKIVSFEAIADTSVKGGNTKG